MIKRIFLDFGGCIDAPGIHTRSLFWDAFQAEGLLPPEGRLSFQEAYTRADRRMMSTGEAASMALSPFNRWSALLIAGDLSLAETGAERAADRVTSRMSSYLAESREALLPLAGEFELGVISNFTGNLEVILREFRLRDLFDSVTESYHIGVSKPDPAIFRAALATQARLPGQCLYVGDNPVNDIEPARRLGMRTALIHQPGLRKECGADIYLESLRALPSLTQRI